VKDLLTLPVPKISFSFTAMNKWCRSTELYTQMYMIATDKTQKFRLMGKTEMQRWLSLHFVCLMLM